MAKMKKFVQNDNNKAIAYYRYSSHSQSDASIMQQQQLAHQYAEANGLVIVEEYKDEAKSGRTIAGRDDYQRMLKEVSILKPSVCILWKMDRLGRNRKELQHGKDIIQSAGCGLHYLSGVNVDPNASYSVITEGTEEIFAEYWSRVSAEMIVRGMTFNAENCLFNGHMILGYTTELAPEMGKGRKRYVVDPEGSAIVVKIFQDYADGKPMVDIARELNGKGLTNVRGNKFTVNNLAHTLNQRAYIGEYQWGDIITPGGMPVIISDDLFEACQKRLIQNKRNGGQRANGLDETEAPRFWLTGKIFCARCGENMQGTSGTSKTGTKHYYYACVNHLKKRGCDMKRIQKDKIEAIVLRLLFNFLKDEANLASVAADVAAYHEKKRTDNAFLNTLKEDLKLVEKNLENVLKAIMDGASGEAVNIKLKELEERKKLLKDAIATEEARKALYDEEISLQHFFDLYKSLEFEKFIEPEQRDYLFDYFVDKIYVDDDQIVITCWYGDDRRDIYWNDVVFETGKTVKKNLGAEAVKGSSTYGSAPPKTRYSNLCD